jgi:hypothetical protein
MFEDYARQTNVAVASQLCGFLVILCGVFVLQVTKDVDKGGAGRAGKRGQATTVSRLFEKHSHK